jgi:transcriptional regulator with XRE-family HTH domain
MPPAHNIQFRACRKRSGLSQAEVARLLGFSTPSPISRIEHAHREPDFKTALACEFLFGKPVSHILVVPQALV